MESAIVPGPGWAELAAAIDGGTVMIVGRGGTGKSHLARYLLERLGRGALLSADNGQPSLGVPACLALGLRAPWRTPAAMWFVGETSPAGNLLPVVVGTARLAARAREAGAPLVVIDTSGLVEGPLGRLLKYHKALAAGVDRVVAVQRDGELETLLGLLANGRRVHRVAPADVAHDRDRDQRRAYREAGFRAHLRGASRLRFQMRRLIGPDWAPAVVASPGTIVGLLDSAGFCLRLGVVHAARESAVEVRARWRTPRAVARVQVGSLRLAPDGSEVRGIR